MSEGHTLGQDWFTHTIPVGRLLDALGVKNRILAYGDTRHENTAANRRIMVIAASRNVALAPLYTGQVAGALGGEADEVFFLNDIYFCAPDLLEVILQYRQQGMHQACAMDWERGVYDRWVLRAISGKGWYHQEDLLDYFGTPDDHPKTPPVALLDDEVG